jgi:hypothetical protein
MLPFAIAVRAIFAVFFFKNELCFIAVWASIIFLESPVNLGMIPCNLAFFFTARQLFFAVDVVFDFAFFATYWALKHLYLLHELTFFYLSRYSYHIGA